VLRGYEKYRLPVWRTWTFESEFSICNQTRTDNLPYKLLIPVFRFYSRTPLSRMAKISEIVDKNSVWKNWKASDNCVGMTSGYPTYGLDGGRVENKWAGRSVNGENLRNPPIPNLNRRILSQMIKSNYPLRARPMPPARLAYRSKKRKTPQNLGLIPLQINELCCLLWAVVMWYFRIGLRENPGHWIYFLYAQGLEISEFSSSPETLKIRDSEVYFYVARTNREKLSGTTKNQGEWGPGQRGATVHAGDL